MAFKTFNFLTFSPEFLCLITYTVGIQFDGILFIFLTKQQIFEFVMHRSILLRKCLFWFWKLIYIK